MISSVPTERTSAVSIAHIARHTGGVCPGPPGWREGRGAGLRSADMA